MAHKDPDKRREYSRRYYANADQKKKQQQRVRERKRRLSADYYAWKATKYCLRCGEKDPICLEFHHIDPATKDIEPGNMVRQRGWSIQKITAHLDATCICLCSNCHKKIHRELKHHHAKLKEAASLATHRPEKTPEITSAD